MPEWKFDRLDPEQWKTIISGWVSDEQTVECERVSEDKIQIMIDLYDEDMHTDLQRQVGMIAEDCDLSISTEKRDNTFQNSVMDSVIEISK